MNIFRVFFRSYKWSKILKYGSSGRIDKAILITEDISKREKLTMYERMYYAILKLRSGEFDKSQELLQGIEIETSGSDNPDNVYLYHLSRSILFAMKGRMDLERREEVMAAQSGAHPRMQRWFPLRIRNSSSKYPADIDR